MKRLRTLVALADVVGAVVSLLVVAWIEYGIGESWSSSGWERLVARIALFVLWMLVLSLTDSREASVVLSGSDYYARSIRATFGAYGLGAVLALATGAEHTRVLIALGLPVGVIVLTASRWLLRDALLRQVRRQSGGWMKQRVLTVVAPAGDGSRASATILSSGLYESVGWVAASNPAEVLHAVESTRPSMVLVSRSSVLTARELQLLGWELDSVGTSLCIEPGSGFIRPGRTSLLPHPTTTLLLVRTVHLSRRDRFVKRVADLLLVSVLIPLLLPIAVVAAIAIVVEDGRPVLFRQRRIGRGGRRFTLYKLRTMYRDADERRPPPRERKRQHDPRCTRVGSTLRRWSIDEIPQLWCVLIGSMSLVGPRPRMETEFVDTPEEVRRLEARPGISGLWQTSGRSDLSFEEADLLDVEYVDNWSLIGDLVILARTVRTVLSRQGAY